MTLKVTLTPGATLTWGHPPAGSERRLGITPAFPGGGGDGAVLIAMIQEATGAPPDAPVPSL